MRQHPPQSPSRQARKVFVCVCIFKRHILKIIPTHRTYRKYSLSFETTAESEIIAPCESLLVILEGKK